MCRRLVPGVALLACLVLSVSAAVALTVVHLWGTARGPMQDVARVCGVLAFSWSACAAAVRWAPVRSGAAGSAYREFVSLARVVALLLGVVTAIVQTVVLTIRLASVAVDLMNGYPSASTFRFGFGVEGSWSLLLLFAACTVSAVSTGDRRLWTCQLWSAILVACWVCLLVPVLRTVPTGGFERTGSSLLLPVALSAVLALAILIASWIEERHTSRVAPASSDGDGAFSVAWPGLTASVTAIAVAITLLACYHLAVPVALGPGGFRTGSLIITGSLATAAMACFLLARRGWSAPLCDAAMWLTSVGFCALATVAVPAQPVGLAERYPMIFNAMIVGSAFATGFWTHLACDWAQQSGEPSARAIRVHLAPRAKRFAFLNAALALVLGAAMAIWPRWPAIAAMDDSLGRVAAGFAGNLFLLLVLLWSSRRMHRLAFEVLTVLSVISAAGFLTIRMLPFTPQFG